MHREKRHRACGSGHSALRGNSRDFRCVSSLRTSAKGASVRAWGCPQILSGAPSPRGSNANCTDHCLPAGLDRDALDPDRLFAIATVSFQRLDLSREGSGQFIERSLGTLLLRKVLCKGRINSRPLRRSKTRPVLAGILNDEGARSGPFIVLADPVAQVSRISPVSGS